MLVRQLLLIIAYLSVHLNSVGQVITSCITSLNQQQILITTCSTQYSSSALHQVFKGTPFFTYPNWQAGSVQLTGQQRALAGEVAYDVVDNNVYYRFDSTQSELVQPDVLIKLSLLVNRHL